VIYLLAFFLPWLAVMLKGRIFTGIALLVLEVLGIFTVGGTWLLAVVIAFLVIHGIHADERNQDLIAAMQR